MDKVISKIENISKGVVAIVTGAGTILGVLIGIYHGIYKLNQTANNLVKSLPVIENNMKFADINVDYDIALAEKQLSIGIYHGIYKLNQTANNLVKSLPVIENNMKFADINVDYDIALAEKQLSEKDCIDRILMRKLLLYKKDLKLTSSQITSINYLESKTKY